ncbi:MAG: NAD(P)H-binding protein, partial [Gammaproteobacteria bacterium]|nr:NAD(P)H-binding protein [Gammaproteobacteria bacterium]
MKTKPILITGVSGSIGSKLARNLIARKVPVRLALRDPKQSPYENNALVETVYFDYRDKNSLQKAVEGVEQVFFLTPATMQAKQEAFNELETALAFIEIMRAAGVQHVVRSSGMGADQFKESAHYLIEQAVQQSGMAYTILRPTFFMQIFDVYYRNSIQKKYVIDFYDANVTESF